MNIENMAYTILMATSIDKQLPTNNRVNIYYTGY